MNSTFHNLTKLIGLTPPEDHRTRVTPERHPGDDGVTTTQTHTSPCMREAVDRTACMAAETPTLLVVDVSGSIGDPYLGAKSKVQAAGLAAQSHIVERRKQSSRARIGLVTFDRDARVVCPLVTLEEGQPQLIRAVRSLTTGGGTDMGAAMRCAHQQLGEQPGRVVLISDGHGGNPVPYAQKIKDNGGVIDCIGIGRDTGQVDEARLRRAASVTGGEVHYWFIRDLNLLTRTMTMLAANTIAK